MSKIQFRISTCLRSIICLSSWLLACSAIRMWNCRCWLWTAKRNPSSSPPPAARPLEERVDVAGQAPQLAPVHGGRPLGKQPRRLRFECFAQLVQLAHVGPRRDLDARAGAGPRLDQTVLLEPLQRVADRQHAHAELPRQPPPRQRRARTEADREESRLELRGRPRRRGSPPCVHASPQEAWQTLRAKSSGPSRRASFRPGSFGSRNVMTSTASNTSAAARTSSPAEYDPLTPRNHPMTVGPTNPPRLPTELMSAMPAAAAVPPRTIGGIAQNTPCTDR